MATSGFIVADGIDVLTAQLWGAATQTPEASEEVIQKVCEDIEETSRSFVPVDSGDAKSWISSETSVTSYGAVGEVGPEYNGKDSFYPYFLENGTSKMPPYAFMGPALDRHGPEFEDAMADLADL